jgi:hypothetical protein
MPAAIRISVRLCQTSVTFGFSERQTVVRSGSHAAICVSDFISESQWISPRTWNLTESCRTRQNSDDCGDGTDCRKVPHAVVLMEVPSYINQHWEWRWATAAR